MDDASNLAVVLQRAYDWNLWVFPHVEKFPKSYRFSLGENLVNASLSLLMNLVDATYQSRNTGALGNAVRDVNRLRYLVRMSKDLKVLSLSSYEFAAKGLDEIGRMAGGWFKSARAKEGARV
jgi:four helix bundle protein